jgi:hypothetical protein
MLIRIFPLVLIIAFASCSSDPVKIVVDKKDLTTGKITIDGKQTYNFKDSVVSFELMPGKHSFVLNNEAPKEFTVGEQGGLLNLDNQEYVAYEIEYAEQNSNSNFSMNSMSMKAMVMIDSFIIIPKAGFGRQADSSLRKVLPDLKAAKNGNFFFRFKGEGNPYDTDQSVHGLKKFGKDQLYIERYWDYTLGEEVPQTLTIMTKKNSISFGSSSTTRTSIMHAPIFLLMARLSPEEYTIKSIAEIEAGTEDKVKEEIKEKNQMKFE